MPTPLPSFVQGEAVDAVAEFLAFQQAAPEPAAEALALLTWIKAFGLGYVPPNHHVGPRGLYCCQSAGWAVFYAGSGPLRAACEVTVLAVLSLEGQPYNALVTEAQRRKQALNI